MEKSLKAPFSRIGGKAQLQAEIIKMMPEHETYVEPFIGGGTVFFRKPLAKRNVINDLDKNIYDVMRDLAYENIKIDYEFTPETNATRENFLILLPQTNIQDPNERLFRNLFLINNSYGANMKKIGYTDPASWKTTRNKYLRDHLTEYQYKLNRTEIRNEDYAKIVEEYDGEKTFFFFDPPYSKNIKYWDYPTPPLKAEELLKVLQSIKGKFIMSYDDTESNNEIFKEFNIIKTSPFYKVKSKAPRKASEILIFNFPLPLAPV